MTLHSTNLSRDPELEGSITRTHFWSSQKSLYQTSAKRILETSLILLCLPVVLPLIGLLALLTACDGHSPFYRQKRVGLDGRFFQMWKLRTMVPNADRLLAEHLKSDPKAKAEWETTQKLKNDPRITRIGAVLRRTSLDELPQLLNVVKGDMAIVGPRPMMVEQLPLYPGHGYFYVRPGITGLWQVTDRNNCRFSERAYYDDKYSRDVTLSADLKIMLKTVTVMMRGTGY